ncbi:MAG: lipoyl synthase [Nitrososphaerota archaeon]
MQERLIRECNYLLNVQTNSKPEWLTVIPKKNEEYIKLKELFRSLNLHTVCEEAHCPNVFECWNAGTATLMLLGDVCSRACRFCMVKPGKPNGVVDEMEPEHVGYALSKMNLSYVVLTSVDRDDLKDGGASHFARTILQVRKWNPHITIEVLIPDFQNDIYALAEVVKAKPDVIAHNIETTMFLTRTVRDPRAGYWQSLSVLRNVKKLDRNIYTKSSIMVGLGETEEEIQLAMMHLRQADVDFLTIGQYLRPSPRHLAVKEYLSPSKFDYYKRLGEEMGFKYVASGPFVRSSYRAGEYFIMAAVEAKKHS